MRGKSIFGSSTCSTRYISCALCEPKYVYSLCTLFKLVTLIELKKVINAAMFKDELPL
uniref:Uncharacterized protein n=1 Tax=Tetranychus urticae TaxID=32264 RepID=T1L0Q9_TETUR